MARKKKNDVEMEEATKALIPEEIELDEDEMEDLKDVQEDEMEERREEDMDLSREYQELEEAYGSPNADEVHNIHTILDKAMYQKKDTIRTTFLTESELGRPLFSVRFLLDMYKYSMHHDLDRIGSYFWNKVQNVTSSGLSNKGFGLNITVTQKRDTTRRRLSEKPIDDKGGNLR